MAGFSSVSALAHLGGAAVGLAAWAVWRLLMPQSRVSLGAEIEATPPGVEA